jgi:hypothetical protein
MIIGIDPGKHGAIVTIDAENLVHKYLFPLIGKEFDLPGLVKILRAITHDAYDRYDLPHVYIEDVHAIMGASAGATFSFGFACGIVQGVIAAIKIPYTLVQPKIWQKEMFKGIPETRKPPIKIKTGARAGQMMKGKRDTKKMAALAAKRLFPSVDLRRTPQCRLLHDGIIDALLIAEYGRRQMGGR